VSRLRGVRSVGFANADAVAKKVRDLYDEGEFDVCTLFYSEFKSVISQIPTAQQAHSGRRSGAPQPPRAAPVYEYEPEQAEILADLIAAQHLGPDLPGAAGERGRRAGRRMSRWTTRPAMPVT
jgi:F-type H+-transporting ATPase subunit gamma